MARDSTEADNWVMVGAVGMVMVWKGGWSGCRMMASIRPVQTASTAFGSNAVTLSEREKHLDVHQSDNRLNEIATREADKSLDLANV